MELSVKVGDEFREEFLQQFSLENLESYITKKKTEKKENKKKENEPEFICTVPDLSYEQISSDDLPEEDVNISLEDVSSSSEGEYMDNREISFSAHGISVTVHNKDKESGSEQYSSDKTLFATDGRVLPVVSELQKLDVVPVIAQNAFLEDVIKEVELLVKRTKSGLKRKIVLSAGHIDISVDNIKKVGSEISDKRDPKLVIFQSIMKCIKNFGNKVKKEGGILYVLSLIPCPAETDPDTSVWDKDWQVEASSLFVKTCDGIIRFNKSNGIVNSVNLRRYFESKNYTVSSKNCGESHRKRFKTSKMFYGNTSQRKIKVELFENDGYSLTAEGCKIVLDALIKCRCLKFST